MTDEVIKADELARRNLGKSLLVALVDELRAAPDVWQKCSEAQQEAVLERLTARITHEAGRAIITLQSADLPSVKGTLESVTIKDGAKLTIKVGLLSPSLHDVIDATGATVIVVLADPEQFTASAEDVQPDADQPSLPLAGEEGIDPDAPPPSSGEEAELEDGGDQEQRA
jgi:hypothetical protein